MLSLLAAALIVLAQPEPPIDPTHITRDGAIERWDEAMPIGSGVVGALIWGKNNVIYVSIDSGELWDERLPEALTSPDFTYAKMIALKEAKDHAAHVKLFDEPYDTIPYPTKLPVGRVELEFPAANTIQRFDLDLVTGTVYVTLAGFPTPVQFKASGPMISARIPGDNKPIIRLLRPTGLDRLGYQPGKWEENKTAMQFIQKCSNNLEYALRAVWYHRAQDTAVIMFPWSNLAGPIPALAPKPPPPPDSSRIVHYSTPEPDPSHTRPGAWSASSITIPDARLQRQYNLCKHLYIAGSEPLSPPMPLQGLWTADEGGLPPWKGDYHNDLNTQMTYLAYHAAALRDQGLSFINYNWNLLPRYRKFAKDFYNVDGAVVPGVMSLAGNPLGGWGQYSLSPTHSAWIAQTFYLHWKHTMDPVFLRERAYPWCSEVGNALAALLNPDGTLPLSSSPEIHDNSYAAWLPPNSNYDGALLRFLFSINAEMADATGDPAAADRWRKTLALLAPLDIDPTTHALTFAKGQPFDQSHRHFSHAMAIHPLGLITIEGSDDDRKTIAATLDQIEAKGTKQWCGYSFAWFSAMCARAGQPQRALKYLRDYERAFTGPNGFHLNGDQSKSGLSDFTYRPFTLEGNFLAMEAMHEMLLQSWGGVVRVFPAVDPSWADVSFDNLSAQGGFRIGATRRAAQTVSVTILAEAPGILHLRDPFPGRTVKWNREDVKLVGGDWTVELKVGDEVNGHASDP
ncbi:MAG: hypothetical protein JSR77_13745 [Planctomycetes bacterium]|nr:hypothetical protein [Planctomycetota bacterium]